MYVCCCEQIKNMKDGSRRFVQSPVRESFSILMWLLTIYYIRLKDEFVRTIGAGGEGSIDPVLDFRTQRSAYFSWSFLMAHYLSARDYRLIEIGRPTD